jgi:hypothetical protein
MYNLELDQDKNFECFLKVQGTSLKKSKINLVIEANELDIKFRGSINESGKVTIPIKKLSNVLDENVTGKLYIEVIAEDTYFVPFKSDYTTSFAKKVTLSESVMLDAKPSVEVLTVKQHAVRFVKQMIEQKVNIFKNSDQQKAFELFAGYIVDNKIEDGQSILNEVLNTAKKLIIK